MTEYTSEHWEPYFDEEEAKAVIGKHLLVGVTHRNHSEEVTGLEQFHGEIIRASREEGIILRLSGSDKERWVPPDLSRLEPATPGNYRLKDSGEVVVDPDLLSTWTVYPPKQSQ
ncbi:hypothetical protein [Azonexus sp. R2A61]|uniref:hypothetical protein n=1 Tax=Azonexus sp. R2A61 TaxID=2744443 RepID=UPI001F193B36|nr:hypothetical protein [Azonexus sp. R2A61]